MVDREPAKLGQLHPAACARRDHHAERPVLRTAPRRDGRYRSGAASSDDPWHGRAPGRADGGGPQAPAAGEPHLLSGMRRQFRHGVAWRATERRPVHPRHDPQRDVHRRHVAHVARCRRGEARCGLDAGGGGGCGGNGPVDPARQGAR